MSTDDSKTTTVPATDTTASEGKAEAPFVGRSVKQAVLSIEQSEGRGARVRRSIGGSKIRNFDPFLMLDEFQINPPGGFPDHPHRGFETVTYILPGSEGTVEHEDFCGHSGTIGAGDVQWMTAGKGILHAEMPGNGKPARGLQLWVNLASKDKLCEPAYQELVAKDIPKAEKDGVHVAVIAGEALGTKAKIFTRTKTHYLHYTLQPNSFIEHRLPSSSWNALLYTLDGEGYVGPRAREHRKEDLHQAHFSLVMSRKADESDGEETSGILVATGEKSFSFVLVAGEPINEPVVQYGPFVMNTTKEIQQAFQDFQSNRNGFEAAKYWQSKIGNKYG